MADKKRNASQSEVAELKTRSNENKSAKAASREREERHRAVKRDSKQPSSRWARFRANRIVAFLFEAYRELRYKVTWPTFQEARNMTIAVIVLSAFVAALLGLADVALLRLFQLLGGH